MSLEIILTGEREEVLKRLHSMPDEEIKQLARQGYGSRARIREVRQDAQRMVQLVLAETPLSPEYIEHLNEEARRSRPCYDAQEGRRTYALEDGEPVDLWYAMFVDIFGSGRINECMCKKCQRIYVYDSRMAGKRAPRFLLKKVF